MSVIAVTSSRTSPGATTLAAGLALAFGQKSDRALLIEADPAGGVLALRADLLPAPSLTSFGNDIRAGFNVEQLWTNTQDLRGARCMPAPVDPQLARSWISWLTPTLAAELPRLGAPAVIDLGWVDHDDGSAHLAATADMTLIVTRPHAAEVQALLFQVRRLQAHNTKVAIVTIGDGSYTPQEIAAVAGVPLAAALPDDPKAAAALINGTFRNSKLKRTMLWRRIHGLATALLLEESLTEELQHAAVAPPPRPVNVVDVRVGQNRVGQNRVGSNHVGGASAEPIAPTVISIGPSPADLVPEPVPEREPLGIGLFDDTVRMDRLESAAVVLPSGEVVGLVNEAVMIGRHSQCDIVLNDSQVSRRHGRLVRTDQGWHFADLGSRNGTEVNHRPCTDTLLTAGDVLTIGRTELTFQTVSLRELKYA